jgi:hypothetical protein
MGQSIDGEAAAGEHSLVVFGVAAKFAVAEFADSTADEAESRKTRTKLRATAFRFISQFPRFLY